MMCQENKPFQLLTEALSFMKLPCDDATLEKFKCFYSLVIEWNKKVNLTSITQVDEFILKHFIDSLMCADFDKMNDIHTIIDVGTGGGFPGIPLAIVYPEKQFFLLDSLNKRILFLKEASSHLCLNNVSFGHGRAEDYGRDPSHREKYDLCVSRAVANLSTLSEYCLPFVKLNGYFLPYKTMNSKKEIEDSLNAISLLGGSLERSKPFSFHSASLDHQILYIKKTKNIPKLYPRKAGIPSKSPL